MGCQVSKPSNAISPLKRSLSIKHNKKQVQKNSKRKQGSEKKPNPKLCIKSLVLKSGPKSQLKRKRQKKIQIIPPAIQTESQELPISPSQSSRLINYSIDYSVDYYKRKMEGLEKRKEMMKKANSPSRYVAKNSLVLMSTNCKEIDLSDVMKGKLNIVMNEELENDGDSNSERNEDSREFSRSLGSFFHSESSISICKIDNEMEGRVGKNRASRGSHEQDRKAASSQSKFSSLRSLCSLNDLI